MTSLEQDEIIAALTEEMTRVMKYANKAIKYEDEDKFGKAIVEYTNAIRVLYNASCFLNGVYFDTTNVSMLQRNRSLHRHFTRGRMYELIWNKIVQLYTRVQKLHDVTQTGAAEVRALMRSIDIPLDIHQSFDESALSSSSLSQFDLIKDVLVQVPLLHTDSFDYIIGHDNTKTKLFEIATMFSLNANTYTKSILHNRYITSNVMIILYGEPGTGKTSLIKALAAYLHIPLYELKIAQLFNSYVGETEKTMSNIFNWALSTMEPKMIFIDELDAIFSKRGTGNEQSLDKKIKTIFMTEMNRFVENMDSNNIIIGATNFIEDIDEAIRRRSVLNIEVSRPSSIEEYLALIIHEFDKLKLNYENGIAENIAVYAYDAKFAQSKLVDITKKLFALCTSKITDEMYVIPVSVDDSRNMNNTNTSSSSNKTLYSLNATCLRDSDIKYNIIDNIEHIDDNYKNMIIKINLKTTEGKTMGNNIILPFVTMQMWEDNRTVYLRSSITSNVSS